MKKQTSLYKSLAEFAKAQPKAYAYAISKNRLEYLCEKFGWTYKKWWTLEMCKQDALKYTTRGEWYKAPKSGYKSAHRHGWLDECCKHMIALWERKNYTLKICQKDALKYGTKNEWIKNSGSLYVTASKNKWIDKCCKHMIGGRKPNGYWTKEKCVKEALKYKTKIEWRNTSSGSYTIAEKMNWLDMCCKHMVSGYKGMGLKWTKEKCIKEAKKFKTKAEWPTHGNKKKKIWILDKRKLYYRC